LVKESNVNRVTRAAALALTVAAPLCHSPILSARASGRPLQEQTVTVHLVAERFRFSPDEIRIRRGSTVAFVLESDDTDHGFRIVGTDIDRIIPKRGRGSITVTFTPDRAGRFNFECSKVCGAGHNFMHGLLIVEEP
jgi:cytochrome c oxidase subunit II